MKKNTLFEQTRFSQKIKEFSTLFFFISMAIIFSLLLMDIIIFPITLFSIKNSDFFTITVKYTTLFLIVFYVFYSIFRSVYSLYKEGLSFLDITKKILSYISTVFFSGFFVITSCFLVIAFIYFILKYNYYFLYKLIN